MGETPGENQAPKHKRERAESCQHGPRPTESAQISDGWWRVALPPVDWDAQGGRVVDYPGLPALIRTLEAQ